MGLAGRVRMPKGHKDWEMRIPKQERADYKLPRGLYTRAVSKKSATSGILIGGILYSRIIILQSILGNVDCLEHRTVLIYN